MQHRPQTQFPYHPPSPHPPYKAHYSKYEPTILELKRKYEAAMKEKMLAGLDRDKMAAKVGGGLLT